MFGDLVNFGSLVSFGKKMGKKKYKPEKIHKSYCCGQGWIGDGSKETSKCPFHHSQTISAVRYICSHCAGRTTPKDIFAAVGDIPVKTEKGESGDTPREQGKPSAPTNRDEPDSKRTRTNKRKTKKKN